MHQTLRLHSLEVASGYYFDPTYMYLDSNIKGLPSNFSAYYKLEAINREKDIASKGWLPAARGDNWPLDAKESQKTEKPYQDSMLS